MKKAPEYDSFFSESYDKHTLDSTLSGRFLQRSHSLLEGSLPPGFNADRVLEVGAGTGQHFSFVKHPFSQYTLTDSNDAMLRIAAGRHSQDISSGRLAVSRQDATRLEFPDQSFDRLIATHVLEHIPNPVGALREWDRVVKKGGLLSIVLPCDPGLLWRFGRYLGPRRNVQSQDQPYDYIMASEHINPIFNLVVFIRYHFESLQELWYPMRVAVPDINLFYVCHIRK